MFQGKKTHFCGSTPFFRFLTDPNKQETSSWLFFFSSNVLRKRILDLHRNIYFGELPYNVARVKCGEVAILLHVEQSHAGVVDDLKKNIIIKSQLNNIFYSKVNKCIYTSTFTNYEAENL